MLDVQREARHRRRALYSRRLIKLRDSLHETVAAYEFITRARAIYLRATKALYKKRADKRASARDEDRAQRSIAPSSDRSAVNAQSRRDYFSIFDASSSTCSICGGFASSAEAFAINAAAMGPARCAFLSASLANASKMPKVEGPRRSANQTGVLVSCCASGNADSRNLATSPSFPGFASRRTNNASLTMVASLLVGKEHQTGGRHVL